jgi:SAM-dependent methyltransferase
MDMTTQQYDLMRVEDVERLGEHFLDAAVTDRRGREIIRHKRIDPLVLYCYLQYFQREVVPARGVPRICDLGCGTGYQLAAFTLAGAKAYGIERHAHIADIARRKLGGINLRTQPLVVVKDYFDDDLPEARLGDGSTINDMDVLVCNTYNSYHHWAVMLNLLIRPSVKKGMIVMLQTLDGPSLLELDVPDLYSRTGFMPHGNSEDLNLDVLVKSEEPSICAEEVEWLNTRYSLTRYLPKGPREYPQGPQNRLFVPDTR